MRHNQLQHRFVDYIPEQLEEGLLYISIEYTTVAHLCCCGCKQEVSITLSPTDWRLIFDGKTVSIEPSIGSWSLPCQSHYFITKNQVVWARQWSKQEITTGRQYDIGHKLLHRATESAAASTDESVPVVPVEHMLEKRGVINWLKSWWA